MKVKTTFNHNCFKEIIEQKNVAEEISTTLIKRSSESESRSKSCLKQNYNNNLLQMKIPKYLYKNIDY